MIYADADGGLSIHHAANVIEFTCLQRNVGAAAYPTAGIVQPADAVQSQFAGGVDAPSLAIVQQLRTGAQAAAGQQFSALAVYLAGPAIQFQLLQRTELALAVQDIVLRQQRQPSVAVHLAAGVVQAGQLEFGTAQAENFAATVACCTGFQLQIGAAAYLALVVVEAADLQALRLFAQQFAALVVQRSIHLDHKRALAFQRAAGIAQAAGLQFQRRASVDAAAVIVQMA